MVVWSGLGLGLGLVWVGSEEKVGERNGDQIRTQVGFNQGQGTPHDMDWGSWELLKVSTRRFQLGT